MDSPVLCVACEGLFDASVHFITRPYRPVCPFCGQIHEGAEPDWKSYAGY